MSLLSNLLALSEGEDLTRLPHDVMTELQGNIRKGAADIEQKWVNALHLVQKAYDIAGIQRPDPSMGEAWKQYEENITYAVKQLAKFRGMNDDWRMSASVFKEAVEGVNYLGRFSVSGLGDTDIVIEARTIEEVTAHIQETLEATYDVEVSQTVNGATITCSRWGITRPNCIVITPKQ